MSTPAFPVPTFPAYGFSGSKEPKGHIPVSALSYAGGLVPTSSRVFVGCQRGVDAYFRSFFGDRAQVFSVASDQFGVGRSAFARRSVACVDAVRTAGGLWVAFPASPCPVGLVPHRSSSRCFSGFGSGTWASLAYAIGSGCSALWYGFDPGWSLTDGTLTTDGSWFFYQPLPVGQLSLF